MTDIKITVIGIEKIQAALDKFPREISKYMGQAGNEAAKNLLQLEGLKKYPPAGPWNSPPPPYYKRGTGTVGKNKTWSTSERLGTQWYVKKEGMGTEVGNRASYAQYLHGEKPVYWAVSHGWRQLVDTATHYKKEITETYQAWVAKLIKDLGL